MSTLDIFAAPHQHGWTVTVPALGLVTQSSDFAGVETAALQALAATSEGPGGDVPVRVHVLSEFDSSPQTAPPRGSATASHARHGGEADAVVTRLQLSSSSGLWVVSSVSNTRYFLDLDAGLLLRQPGALSATGPYDGVWVRLLRVTNLNGTGLVEVGLRHKYDLDPGPGTPDCRWWVQRAATAIHPVAAAQRPAGRAAARDEDARPYTHAHQGTAPSSPNGRDGGDDARA